MNVDYHAHSNYSDGSFLWSMLSAAEEAELDGLGFADHCNVSPREPMVVRKKAMGFNLDLTYERRREAIDHLRDRFDVRIFDAAEIDYDADEEAEIETFLDEANFDYTIGSVHTLDGMNVHVESYFARKSESERSDLVADYFDDLVALVDSELCDIAAHLDLVERNPALRDFATDQQYHRVATALESSATVPEINAGRVLGDYGELHPTPVFLDVLLDHDIEFVLGTDSHEPEEIGPRKRELEAFVDEHDIPTTELDLES